MRVSLESRYGMCPLALIGSATASKPRIARWPRDLRVEITLPSASKPLLIEMPSFILSPCAAVRFNRSDPAKSTMLNLLVTTTYSESDGLGPTNEFGLDIPGVPFENALGGTTDLVPDGVGDRAAAIPTIDVGLFSCRVGVDTSLMGCDALDTSRFLRFWTRVSEKMACDRDDVAFIPVSPVFRLADPSYRYCMTSVRLRTLTSRTPDQMILPSRSSRIEMDTPVPESRSMISSLYSSRKLRRHSHDAPGPEDWRNASARSNIVDTVRGMRPVRGVNSAPA